MFLRKALIRELALIERREGTWEAKQLSNVATLYELTLDHSVNVSIQIRDQLLVCFPLVANA